MNRNLKLLVIVCIAFLSATGSNQIPSSLKTTYQDAFLVGTAVNQNIVLGRSEERRVGKECR